MSLIDASDLNTSPLVYMIEDMLPECGAGFFWGPSGSGKTFTILDAALAVGNARPFLGHKTLRGRVAYMCGEGQNGLGVRVKGRLLRQEHDNKKAIAEVARTQGDEAARSFAAALPPYTSENLKIDAQPFPLSVTGSKPNPDMEQAMGELRALNSPRARGEDETKEDYDQVVANWPYLRLVILDALENFASPLSVSHRSSANKIIGAMQWMAAELQCCVLAIAHPVTGPGGEMKMVGSDRLYAAADFVIKYAPDDVAAPGALNTATISCQKSKDDTKFASFGVELHPMAWDEPKMDENWEPIPFRDENGNLATNPETGQPWETEEVTSQTVRLIEQGTSSGPKASGRPIMATPELRDNRPASRVRPITRPKPRSGVTLVRDLPGSVTVPASAVPAVAQVPRASDIKPPAPAPSPAPAPAPPAPSPAPAPAPPAPSTAPAAATAGDRPLTTPASAARLLLYFARQILAQPCEDCGRPAAVSRTRWCSGSPWKGSCALTTPGCSPRR
jgi:AAA domain-containing protein